MYFYKCHYNYITVESQNIVILQYLDDQIETIIVILTIFRF